MMKCFIDTNVLVYARDRNEPSKRTKASAWLEKLRKAEAGVLSAQVLREYYARVTLARRPLLDPERARADVRALLPWVADEAWHDDLERTWDLQDRYRLSFWDSLLLASARASSCDCFLSEDMHHGLDVDGVVILNPFLSKSEDLVFGS